MLRAAIAAGALALCLSSASATYINNQLDQRWVSFRDITLSDYAAKATQYRAAGYRMLDLDIYPHGSGLLYSQVWEKNADTRAWVEYRNMTGAEYAQRWQGLGSAGFRPHDFESYRSGPTQLYAGIWVRNTENLSWSSRRDMTGSQYAAYFNQQRAAGRRPVDIDVYQTASGLRYAAIWYQNVGNVAWIQLRNMTLTTFRSHLAAKYTAGYRVIDFETYFVGTTQHFAAIWEQNPAGRGTQMLYNLTELQFSNYWRRFRDEGYRIVEFQRYSTPAGLRYGESGWRTTLASTTRANTN